MKWIGQHIWDFISRFRTTVYIENLETSSNENVLVVDSDGKVTKNTTLGGADLTYNGSTANGVLTYGSASTIDVESDIYFNSSDLTILDSGTGGGPTITLSNSNTDEYGPDLKFVKTQNGGNNDILGKFTFMGKDDGGGSHDFATISATIADATAGEEACNLTFQVASYDGVLTNGLRLLGDTDADGEVDVVIGAGAASMTHIAGDLDIDGDNVTAAGALTITPGGTFTVAGGSNEIDLTTTGTLDIDAGVLDIDVTGHSTLDTTRLTLVGAGGLMIMDTTTSSATEGGRLTLANDDGAAMGSGHRLGVITFQGAEDASNNSITGARIEALCDAAWSASENGADLVFYTTDGNASESEVMRCTASTGVSIPSRKYELPSSTVGDYKGGDIYYYGDGSTVKGGIYYIDGTNWTLADADAEASTSGLLAVALGTDPDADGMLLRGFCTLLTEVEGTEAIGSPIYLSATNSGKATITVPGSGDFVRVLGYSLHATDNQVYFNPDNTWVEVA